jgi:predicted RND superfamily exporter protein
MSLTTIPNPEDINNQLTFDAYIDTIEGDDGMIELRNPHLDMAAWKKSLRETTAVYGKLVAEDASYALIVVLLAHDHDQEKVYWNCVKLLEGKEISTAARYLRYDIEPVHNHIGVGGWVVARETVDLTLRFDVLMLMALGMMLVFFILLGFFGSWRDAIIGVGQIVAGLIWTRGSIPLLAELEFGVENEKVYILLVFTVLIVQGGSMILHKLHSYHEHLKGSSWQNRVNAWTEARGINSTIGFIAVISILGMLTLYVFEVRTMREMGVLAGFGLAYHTLFSLVVLPAAHLLFGGDKRKSTQTSRGLVQRWSKAVGSFVSRCVTFIQRMVCAGPNAWPLFGAAIIAVAVVLVVTGQVKVGTSPLDFIKGTHVWKTTTDLNRGPGSDSIEIMIEPYDLAAKLTPTKKVDLPMNADIEEAFDDFEDFGDGDEWDNVEIAVTSNYEVMRDATFLKAVRKLVKEIDSHPDVRSTSSITDSVHDVIVELTGGDILFPKSDGQAGDILTLIENASLPPQDIRNDLYGQHAVKVSAWVTVDNSETILALSEWLKGEVAERYPSLTLTFGGKTFLWAVQDKYITIGKPLNVAAGEILVILIVMCMFLYRNRKRARRLFGPMGPIRTSFVLATPLLFASACMVILMVLVSIRLDQANAVIMAMALGASIDFAIYYADEYHQAIVLGKTWREAIAFAFEKSGKPIFEDVMMNAVCFLPLIASSFKPVAMIGWQTALMVIFAGFGSLVIMPAMLRWCHKGQKTALASE